MRSGQRKNLLTSPGTVTYIGPDIQLHTKIQKISYNDTYFNIEPVKTLPDCLPIKGGDKKITWLDVDGIHETGLIEKIGKLYNLHSLLLEDVVNTEHKPKLDIYEDSGLIFLTMKMLHINDEMPVHITSEHVSFVLGESFVISFQEELNTDIFLPVLMRLQTTVGKTRRNNADYLLFALMDTIVDNYFLVLEKLQDQMDDIEDTILSGRNKLSLPDLYSVKREFTHMRRLVLPLREMVNQLIRQDGLLISPEVIPYYRDLYDHVLQITDTIDSYREIMASLADVHLSTISNRMNSVMKTLTIFSAIFMPLTFVVGVYGMNFDNMPELRWHYGYFYTLGFMALITVGMIIYFRRKHWV